MKGDMTDNNENKETLTFAKIWEDFIDTTALYITSILQCFVYLRHYTYGIVMNLLD
jgi:hypothetical protein